MDDALKSLTLSILGFLIMPVAVADVYQSIQCSAHILNSRTNRMETVHLKRTSFDHLYYRADLQQYSFGADTFYKDVDGIGLIIYNNHTRNASASVVGFRRIPETPRQIASLHLDEDLSDGSRNNTEVKCVIEAP